jgi:hypothetical protein
MTGIPQNQQEYYELPLLHQLMEDGNGNAV